MEKSPGWKAMNGVEVELAARLGERVLELEEVLALRPGSTIPLSERADQPLRLEVDGVPLAEGFAVEKDGRLGFEVERLLEDGAPDGPQS